MAGKRTRWTTLPAITAAAVCTALLTVSAPAARAGTTAEAHPATLAALQAFQARGGPGAAVYAGDGNSSWTLSAGTGTTGANRPVQADEYLRSGSQTKTFTAAVVLQLVDEGKVSPDEPIETYLPGVVTGNGYDGTRITVRHLLQHTSGAAAYTPDPLVNHPAPLPDGTYDLTASIRKGLAFAPVSVPGARFTYSNTNYLVLSLLIERITGQPVHEAVTDRVITPLGLTRTVFAAPGERSLPSPAVRGYHGVRVGGFFLWFPATEADPTLYSGAGAVVSTLEDLSTFYRALIGGRLLSPGMLAEMRAAVDTDTYGSGYGLGLIRVPLTCGGVAWGHDGGAPGFSTMTLVTEDGRHASLVTNVLAQFNAPGSERALLIDTALCEDRPRQP